MYYLTQLENGLRVATAEMPHLVSASVGVWVGVGSRYEPPQLNGVCHFIEHMVFKGTRRRSARDISQAVEGIGGYLNAFTSEEATCYHARVGHEQFSEALDVLMDMRLHSLFKPSDIAKEREVIKEEMAMYLDEPQHQVQELLNATMWPNQPLGRPITGTDQSLNGLRRTQLVGFLGEKYTPANTVVVAAGRVRHSQVLRAVQRYVRSLRAGRAPSFEAAFTEQTVPRASLISKPIEQTQIALGTRTCSRHDERRYALRLLNAVLGENMSSRLFQVIREDHGLAYSVYSTPSFFADAGDLVIYAGLDTENLIKTLRLILRELRRLVDKPIGAAELRRARDYVIGQLNLGQESADNQMNWVGEQVLGYGRIYAPAMVKRRLAQVTAAQIQGAAKDFFRGENLSLALVSPLRRTEAVRKAMIL
jgi:predicted Zn-dependent peptidase